MSAIQERVKALDETRAQVWHEAQGFLADLKGREMNEEENTQWSRYNERIDALKHERDQLVERETNEREAGQLREAQSIAFDREADLNPRDDSDGLTYNQRLQQWALGRHRFETSDPEEKGRVTNAVRTNIVRAYKERELLRQGASPEEIRAVVWDTGSSASVVPTTLDRSIYLVLEAEIAGLRMPTRKFFTDSGETMDFGKVATNSIATQVAGQGTTFAGSDPVFGKLTLTPNKFGELVEVNADVISDAGVDMADLLASQVGRAVGRVVNEHIVDQMIGGVVTGAAGTTSTGGSLITPTYEHLVNLEYSVNSAYRSSPSTAWLALDSTAGTLRKLRDGNGGTLGSPIWQPSVQTGIANQMQPDNLFGHAFYTDPNVAAQGSNAKIIFFGDWNGFYTRFVGTGPVIERNDSVGFKEDDIFFRGKWRATGDYQDLTAVNLLKMSVS